MFNNFNSKRLEQLNCLIDHPVGDLSWRYFRQLSKVRKLIVHHAAALGTGNWEKDVAMLYSFHKNRGWKGIGYSFVITSEIRNGHAVVVYVGDINTVRAHDPNEKGKSWSPRNYGNEYSLGIVFMNDHSRPGTTYMLEQLKSARIILEDLLADQRLSASTWDDIYGHGFSSYTWCPDGQQGMDIINVIQNTQINLPINPPIMDINWGTIIPESQDWDSLVAEKRLAPKNFKNFKYLIAQIVNEGQEFGSQIVNDNNNPAKKKLRALLKEFVDTSLENKNEISKEDIQLMLLKFCVYFELSPKLNEEFIS